MVALFNFLRLGLYGIKRAGGGAAPGSRKLLENGSGFKLNEDGSFKLLE